MPFVYDLHLFLGRPVQFATDEHTQESDGVFGRVPQSILDDEASHLITAHENSLDLQSMHRVSENAYKQYLKSRPNPSAESIRRVKSTDLSTMAVHPLLGSGLEKKELERLQIVDAIKGYKSKSTIFEINSTSKTSASEVMRAKRSKDSQLVDRFSKLREEQVAQSRPQQPADTHTQADSDDTLTVGNEDDDDIKEVFSQVVGGKRKALQETVEQPKCKKKKKLRQSGKDDNFYIPYRPKDFDSERGLSLGTEGSAFEKQASSAVLDLMGDEGDGLNQHKKIMKWDRKRKRFVRETGKEEQKKKIRTESGQVVGVKGRKKNFYEEWKKKNRFEDGGSGSDGETGGGRRPSGGRGRGQRGPSSRNPGGAQWTPGGRRVRSELKTSQQILKQRKKTQKQQFLQRGGMKTLRSKNKKFVGEFKKSAFGRGGQKKGKIRKKL